MPLAEPGRSFRHSARELLALSAWRNHDFAAARRYIDMIATDAETPPGTRARAEVLSALIAGRRQQELRISVMRRMHRIVLFAGLLALAPVLAGCENFDMDKLDVSISTKRRSCRASARSCSRMACRASRKGIPPEYLKGNQPPPDAALTPLPARRRGRSPATKPAAPAPAAKTAAIEPTASRSPSRNPSASRSRARRPVSRKRRSPCSRRPRARQRPAATGALAGHGAAAAGAARRRHRALGLPRRRPATSSR